MQSPSSPVLKSSNFLTFILCTLLFSTLCFAAAPDRITAPIAAASVRLPAGVPLQARAEFDKGAVDPSQKMSLTLLTVPSPAQQKALDRLLADQQNPNSPSYHQWLTPEQYADRFGLSSNDVRKITAWLQSNGFTVASTARGRNWIVFNGTAAQVQSVFQTEIHHFVIDGHTYFSNATAPAIPSALSGIVTGLRGLSNFPAKSNAHRAVPGYTLGAGGNSYYFLAPGDIAAMYDINNLIGAGTNGTGQKLAVIGQTDIYLDDLANFRSGFSIPAITGCTTTGTPGVITSCSGGNFQYLYADSATGTDPHSPTAGDLGEADIDLEWSNAVARDATIVYVNAPLTGVFTSAYYAIDNNVAPVITMSYTTPCELAEADNDAFASDEAELKKANSLGITFFNSAGDTGAAECDYGSNIAQYGYAVAYPASSPEVTGVGGTSIPAINPGEYTSSFWNSTNDGNGDGGSAKGYIPEQAWNDAEEFGYVCAAQGSCLLNSQTVTNWATAQTAIGISGGGGGVSNCFSIDGNGVCNGGFPQPSWQSGISASLINPSGGGVTTTPARYTPDVSLLASANFPGYIVCTAASEVGGSGNSSTCTGGASGISSMLSACIAGTGPCPIFGGTSVSSPVMAGIATLLNQYVVAKGVQATPGLGNINPSLYKLAASNSTNKAFNFVETPNTGAYSDGAFCQEGTPTSGVPSDPWPVALQCPSSGASAGFIGFDTYNVSAESNSPSYNLVTGLGSVDAGNLFTAWVAQSTPTFSVSASPTSLSVVQGAAGTSTITVTSTNGFNSAVTLSASGLPTGVTAAFSPNPVTPPANSTVTSTLTLTVGASVTPGTYTVTITGTAGSSTATTTVSLTVTPSATFALSAAPTSVSVAQGAAGTSVITVTSSNSFNSAVTLSASGLPTGVTAGFSPNPVTPPANGTVTSTLTLTVGSSVTPGTSTITITGTAGSLTKTTTVSLTVTAGPSFTLSAAPSSLTIAQGLNNTSTITVTSVSGFNAAVALTATGMPAGVSALLSPTSVTPPANGTATSTLTVTVTAGVTPGTYPITVTGTSGSLTQTATVSLTVVAPFSLTAAPSSLTITPTLTGKTSTITVTDAGGFSGNVTLSASGLPTGVTAGFSPNPTGTTSTLTLTAGASASAGTSTVTISGVGGGVTETTTISLTVTAPPSFTLSSNPASISITPTLPGVGSTITETSVNGFSAATTFTTSTLPTGVTAAFVPTSLTPPANGTATTVVTFTASASAAAGTTTVTITGTSGSVTATTTVAVTVTPPPNFTLTSNPTSVSIVPGGAGGTSTITVNPTNGFTGTVTFSIAALPVGVSRSFNPTSSTTGTVLTLTASSTAPGGTGTVTITGTSGALTATTTVSLTVAQNFTYPPTLTAPASADPGQTTSTTMTIAPASGGTFASNVTYTCSSGLPTGATCSFNPAQISSGAGSTDVTITVQTAGPFTGAAGGARKREGKLRSQNQRLWLPLSLPLAGIMLVGLVGKRVPRLYQILGMCLIVALAAFLVACGASSHPPVVTVTPGSVSTLYPSLAGAPAQQQQFSASVSNTTSQTVTWAVTGGGANGTIDQTGLYTAPATLPVPNSPIMVTATSSATTTPGSATVNLQVPTPAGNSTVTVTVTEGSVTHTTSFTLTVL